LTYEESAPTHSDRTLREKRDARQRRLSIGFQIRKKEKRMAKTPLTFWKAREVEEIADPLIKDWHQHLAGETVLYVFRSEHEESNGKIKLGHAKRVTGLNAYLAFRGTLEKGNDPEHGEVAAAAPFYVVEIAYDTWLQLTGPQRIALVDRHGLWRPAIEEFFAAAGQRPLFDSPRKQVPLGDQISTALMDQLQDPKSKASKRLRPKKGSHLTKVTISAGGRRATLRAR
jgi:Putative phage metallopeptidase